MRVPFSHLFQAHPMVYSRKCALQHGRGKSFHLLSVPRVLSSPQEQLIDVFKSVGQVVGFRCDSHPLLFFFIHSNTPSGSFSTGKPESLEVTDFVNLLVHPIHFCPSLFDSCLTHSDPSCAHQNTCVSPVLLSFVFPRSRNCSVCCAKSQQRRRRWASLAN